jgi:2-hydroxychromene-2-carboxylate isomerase
MRGVFAEGIDAGSESGLLKLAQRAGLSQTLVQDALVDDRWRVEAEANRSEMLALGLWGVPSFRVDQQPIQWGQDRLWLIERDLIAADPTKRCV